MALVKFPNFPTKNLAYLLIFGGGILVFIVLAIIPSQQISTGLDYEIKNIKNRIEEQKILTPVYNNLLKKTQFKQSEGITSLKKEKLSRGDAQQISLLFNNIAKNSNLKIVYIKPDVDTLIGESGYILINVRIKGEFINLHKFLFQLCELPSLELVEQIKIASVGGTKEIKLKVWMAQE